MILANGILPQVMDGDGTEELMRIAMELSDRDVYYLGRWSSWKVTMFAPVDDWSDITHTPDGSAGRGVRGPMESWTASLASWRATV